MKEYKIIQLSHPGKEYPGYSKSTGQFVKSSVGINWSSDFSSGTRGWNNLDQHKRKFIFSKDAKYFDSLNGNVKTGDITFWGEWEPHSNFKVISKDTKDFFGPRMLHFPFYDKRYTGRKRQTTDPYVYGDNFWYTHCKQSTESPNQALKHLDNNSIIVMGSERNKDKKFLVDTVFVVKKKHSQNEMIENYSKLTNLLVKINLEMDASHLLLRDKKHSDFGFYMGKNYKDNDIFSFVPAKIYNNENPGHERLVLDTNDKFYNLQRTGSGSVQKLVLKTSSLSDIDNYWMHLVNEAFNQGFVLGVQIPEPTNDPNTNI